LWIEKSIKEGQDPIRTVEASWKKNRHYISMWFSPVLLMQYKL